MKLLITYVHLELPEPFQSLYRQQPGPTAHTTTRTVRPTKAPPRAMIPNLSHAVKNPVTWRVMLLFFPEKKEKMSAVEVCLADVQPNPDNHN